MTDYSMKLPLSYEPLKSILAKMDLQTRENIALQMSSLQKTNEVVPYTFDSAHFSEERIFKVDKKHFEKSQSGGYDSYHKLSRYEQEPVEKDILSLVLRYVRDGTRIRHLTYDDLPKGLAEKNFKIHISELSMFHNGNTFRGMNVEKFQKLLPMIKDSIPLKKVALEYDVLTRSLFEEPLIKTCTELYIRYFYYNNIQIGDLLHHLDNKHIILGIRGGARWTDQMGLDLVRNLTMHWLTTEKSAGRTFTLPHHDYLFIAGVLDDMEKQLGARKTKISELGDDFYASCAVIPMNENLEMVAFGTKYGDGTRSEGMYDLRFALKMAIKARGSTSVPGFFE